MKTFLIILLLGFVSLASANSDLSIQIVSGDEGIGSFVNSVIILGKHEALLVDKNIEYIQNYEKIVHTEKVMTQALLKMKQLYPNYQMERFLNYSLSKYYGPFH